MAILYFSRSSFSFSMCGRRTSSDAFRHISPRIREISVLRIVGLLSLISRLLSCEKYRKADMGRFGADGSWNVQTEVTKKDKKEKKRVGDTADLVRPIVRVSD